jgi:long-chain acyl-CoA synthetase
MPLTRQDALTELTAAQQPYELATQMLRGRPYRVFVNAPRNLRELYRAAISDLPFIIFRDERQTFSDAWNQASSLAHLLIDEYHIQSGDRVAISMRNFPEWITAFMAVTSIGGIAVAMNALWQTEEMVYGLEDCGAKLLICDAERLDRLAPVRNNVGVKVLAVRPKQGSTEEEFHQRLTPHVGKAMPEVPVQPDDAATIFYTSGSTGHPKGVVSTHRNILTALLSWELDAQAGVRIAGTTPQPLPFQAASLLAVPLFHVTGSHAIFLQSYRAQRKLVCMYRWDPDEAAELIEVERITSFTAPAAMTGDLVRVARATRRDLSSLQSVGGGGAPRAPEQVRQIDAAFVTALPNTGWGMTETNAIGTGIGGLDYLARPASSGRCSAVLELKVIDDAGQALPAGQRGELLIRGTSLFREYWNRPEVNATVFNDGWFRTGDVAYLDEDGYLFIVDRIKDLIIRGGENIGCGTVEAALIMHPDVIEAAVYAVPDDRLGEEVGATVFTKGTVDEAALRDFLGGHLAKFEVPRYLRFVSEPLPRTASGKILKRELRDAAVQVLGL